MNQELTREIPHVYRLALRFSQDPHLADDLTQETMLRAVRNLDRLQRPELLRVWLFRILSNCWKDHLRSKIPFRTAPIRDEPRTSAPSAETVAIHQEELQSALSAMNQLPQTQRAVLHLFVVENLSLQEIGLVLEMRPETARVNLHHARSAMRKQLPQFAPTPQTTGRPLLK